jgi:hypothetical protein
MPHISNAELETVIFVVVALGFAGLCWAVAGLQGIYDSIGKGYLDVSTTDPVESPTLDSEADELADAREVWAAIAARRAARGEVVPTADEHLAALARELKEAA